MTVFDVEKLTPWWPMEFEAPEWPIRSAGSARAAASYWAFDDPTAMTGPRQRPAFEVGTYGGVYSVTMVAARPRWKRILCWPRDRWMAWQFDRGRRW